MSYRERDFAGEIALLLKQYAKYAAANAELGTITTALASDTSTPRQDDSRTPPAALQIHSLTYPHFFTNDINLVINKGKGGNLSNATMVMTIDSRYWRRRQAWRGLIISYASANANPPIVGTVCSVTNGNWVGVPTSYTYPMDPQRGTNIGSATSATYTLVSADTGNKADRLCGDGDQRFGLDCSAAVECY